MWRKIFLLMFCFVFVASLAMAKAYTANDAVFSFSFWEKATAKDVKQALKEGYDINTINTWIDGESALDYSGENLLTYAIGHGANAAAVQVLLDNGAAISGKAMTMAKSLDVLKVLFKYTKDVNLLSDDDTTLLHSAHALPLPVVQFLLQNGAEVNIRDLRGNTPLSFLYDYGDAHVDDALEAKEQLLLKAGAKLEAGKTPREAGLVKFKIKRIRIPTYSNEHNYLQRDFWRMANLNLVKQSFLSGEDLNREIDAYWTILAYACAHAHDPAVLDFLIKNGAKIDSASVYAAAVNTNPKILETLLKYINEGTNSEGNSSIFEELDFETALKRAIEAGLKDNVMLLIKKDASLLKNVNMEVYLEDVVYDPKATKGRPDRARVREFFLDEQRKYKKEHGLDDEGLG